MNVQIAHLPDNMPELQDSGAGECSLGSIMAPCKQWEVMSAFDEGHKIVQVEYASEAAPCMLSAKLFNRRNDDAAAIQTKHNHLAIQFCSINMHLQAKSPQNFPMYRHIRFYAGCDSLFCWSFLPGTCERLSIKGMSGRLSKAVHVVAGCLTS